MCQSLFFNKVVDNFIKEKTLAQLFSCEFCEIFKNIFLTEHLLEIASVFQWTLRTNIPEYEFSKASIFITIFFQNLPSKSVLKICSKFKVDLFCNFIEIILQDGCYPVNLLHIFRTLFIRTAMEGCFCFFLAELPFTVTSFFQKKVEHTVDIENN